MKKFLFILFTTIYTTGSLADQPKQWQLGFQDAASQSMREIVSFHNNLLLPVIIAISVFVLFLIIMSKRRKNNEKINSWIATRLSMQILCEV